MIIKITYPAHEHVGLVEVSAEHLRRVPARRLDLDTNLERRICYQRYLKRETILFLNLIIHVANCKDIVFRILKLLISSIAFF